MKRKAHFGKLLSDIMDIDVEEMIDHVNSSQLNEIQKRPRIKLNDDLYYIKNSYDYFKATPVHFISDTPEFKSKNERISAYRTLKSLNEGSGFDEAVFECGEIRHFLVENGLMNSTDLTLTLKGTEYLNSMGWIDDYLLFLDRFDFDEFERFYKNSEKDFMNASLEFLDIHFNLATERHDLKAQFDAQSSRALCQVINGKLSEALDEEMKLFIIRLNPAYASKNELLFHEAVNRVNLHNLSVLFEVCKTTDYEGSFKRNWKTLRIENPPIGEDESLSIFNGAMAGDDLDELNRMAETYYFKSTFSPAFQ